MIGSFLSFLSGISASWIYVITALLAYLECSAFLGVLAPGETFVAFAGFLASRGLLELKVLIPVVVFAAVLGDATGYLLGRIYGRQFLYGTHRFLRIPEAYIDNAEAFFNRHGGKTMLFARFIGFLRALAPFLSGASRAPFVEFIIYDFIGASLWGAGVTLGGFYLGESYQLVEKYAGRAGLFILVAAAAVYLAYRLIKQPVTVVTGLNTLLKKEVIFSAWFLAAASLFVLAAADAVEHRTGDFDAAVSAFLTSIRNPALDFLALFFSALGSLPVVIVFVLLVFAALAARRRKFEAYLFGTSVMLAVVLSYILKYAFHVDRPEKINIIEMPLTYSFPSGHTVAASIIFWILGWMVLREFRGMRKSYAILLFVVPLLVGLSRVYLGVHWMSDVLGGYTLSFMVFSVWAYIYERKWGGAVHEDRRSRNENRA